MVLFFSIVGLFFGPSNLALAKVGDPCTGNTSFFTGAEKGSCVGDGEICAPLSAWERAQGLLPGTRYNGQCQPESEGFTTAAINKGINIIVTLLLGFPFLLSALFSFVSGTLLLWVVKLSTTVVIYTKFGANNPAVTTGWPIVRDFGNIIIAIGLIVISVATILGNEAYGAKRNLPRLIIAALLINFSLLICGIAIDASNILMSFFLTKGNNSWLNIGAGVINNAVDIIQKGDQNPLVFIAIVLGNTFTNVAKGIVEFLYVFLFLFRIMALWILVILSPLAFACAVLPATKKMFDIWLENFTQWCLIGGTGAFFLYLGTEINNTIAKTADYKIDLASTTSFTQSLSGLAQFFVPGMFLIIGFLFAIKISAMGSEYAIKAGKVVGFAGAKLTGRAAEGTYNRTAVKVGNAIESVTGYRLGIIREGETIRGKARDIVTKAGEGVSVVKQGTTNLNQQNRAAEQMKPYQPLAEAEKNSDVLAQRAINSRTGAERAAYTQVLQKRNKLHLIKDDNDPTGVKTRALRQAAIDNAKRYNIDTSEFAKSDYRYAEFDTGPKGIVTRIRATNPALTLDQAKATARQEQLEANLQGMSGEQRRNIDISDLRNPDLVTSRAFTANMVRNFRIADREHINALRDPATRAEFTRLIEEARKVNNRAELNRLRGVRKEIINLP